ncbi:hypothetical protein V2J09_005825 [Rumex salicifolius]
MGLDYDLVVVLPLLFLLFWINGIVLNAHYSHRIEHYFQVNGLPISPASHRNNGGNQPYRTAYHFQPLKNWINGPMLYKGVYHLFYQYNPNDSVWGNITWGHSTSSDLVNWTPQPLALSPSTPSDINGCWSGSATLLRPDNKPAIFYTGINLHNQQVQNLALPENQSDPYLIKWVKHQKNPLMAPTPTIHVNATEFRDPTTAWQLPDGRWRLAVGSKIENRGMALLYTSQDFIHWIKSKEPLYSLDSTGMWECPDFYPVYVDKDRGAETSTVGSGVRHVLKSSVNSHDYYMIGTYDTIKDVFVANDDQGLLGSESGLRYDYGKFYASKTFYDEDKKRRVLWGWVNESCSSEDDKIKGWSGIQTFPRSIILDVSQKQLVQWPVKEIEMLRETKVELPSKVIKGGSMIQVFEVTAAQADVEVSFNISDFSKAEKFDSSWTDPQLLCSRKGTSFTGGIGPFGLLILSSKGLEEYTAVFFRIFRSHNQGFVVLLCSDQSRSSLNPTTDKTSYGTFVKVDPYSHENISLRSLIDHSVIESFGAKGKSCITSRVYPTLAINNEAQLYVFNNGSETVEIIEFRAWNMKQARVGEQIYLNHAQGREGADTTYSAKDDSILSFDKAS